MNAIVRIEDYMKKKKEENKKKSLLQRLFERNAGMGSGSMKHFSPQPKKLVKK